MTLADLLTLAASVGVPVARWAPYLLLAIGLDALLMPWLPVPSDPHSAYGALYALLNTVAQNFRNARNALGPSVVATGTGPAVLAPTAVVSSAVATDAPSAPSSPGTGPRP